MPVAVGVLVAVGGVPVGVGVIVEVGVGDGIGFGPQRLLDGFGSQGREGDLAHEPGGVLGQDGDDMGTGIEGADKSQALAKGDILLVPAETAHQFQNVAGEFVILSVHMFMPERK